MRQDGEPAERRRRLVPLIVAFGVLLTLGGLVLDMSGAAPRQSGSDRVRPLQFSVLMPRGGTVCQPVLGIPPDTATVEPLIGTYYRPLPRISIRFISASGTEVASGEVSGGRQGYVAIPLRRRSRTPATEACLDIHGSYRAAIGGNSAPAGPADAVVNGKRAAAQITLFYLRPGRETWWQLLPVLDLRFGLGKAPFFGRWTLIATFLLALLAWAATIRLLLRELR